MVDTYIYFGKHCFSLQPLELITGAVVGYTVNMGCGSSSNKPRDKAAVIPLTAAQKYLVRETWETVEIHRNSVGKKTFLR